MAQALTDFIDTHLKNKKIEDYADWVATYGRDTEGEYARRVAAADRDYATSRATYGTQGTALRAAGLADGGYAAYLDGVAYRARAEARSEALEDKLTGEAENRRGYADFVGGDKTQDTATAFNKLLSIGIVDEEVAASYLMKMGLAEDEARDLAALNGQIGKNSAALREYILNLCVEKMYNYKVAYAYAIAAGMSKAAAEDVANEVQAHRDAYYNSRK